MKIKNKKGKQSLATGDLSGNIIGDYENSLFKTVLGLSNSKSNDPSSIHQEKRDGGRECTTMQHSDGANHWSPPLPMARLVNGGQVSGG